jgi:subtilisin family serine protease
MGGSEYNQALKDVMENSNALFVCAAGNSARNTDVNPIYPACFDLPNIISVGAFDNKGEIAVFSNYGSKIHVAAPGVDILSTLPGNNTD